MNNIKFQTKEHLAKFAIAYYLRYRRIPVIDKKCINRTLLVKKACFVTIYMNKQLKGCIGNYLPTEPLYQSIVKNAINAAFFDFRFLPIEDKDLNKIKIQVSILSPLKQLKPKNTKDLLSFLSRKKPGVLLEKNGQKALFLPQVWQELKKSEDFLSRLCLKAGLPPFSWKDKDIKYWIFYTT